MFAKIKSKIDVEPEVKEAVTVTMKAAGFGLQIGLVAGVLLIPLTVLGVLAEKAVRD